MGKERDAFAELHVVAARRAQHAPRHHAAHGEDQHEYDPEAAPHASGAAPSASRGAVGCLRRDRIRLRARGWTVGRRLGNRLLRIGPLWGRVGLLRRIGPIIAHW